MRHAFSKDCKLVRGNTLAETVLSNANYPASGSYIDVSGYEWVNVIIHLGTIADAVVFTVKETDSTTGTLDVIDATYCTHTIGTGDDGYYVTFYIETANLSDDHHFLSCVVSSCSGSNYADIMFYLGGARHQPVTQDSTQLPAASQHIFAG